MRSPWLERNPASIAPMNWGEYEYRVTAPGKPRLSGEQTACDTLPNSETKFHLLCREMEVRKKKTSRQIT